MKSQRRYKKHAPISADQLWCAAFCYFPGPTSTHVERSNAWKAASCCARRQIWSRAPAGGRSCGCIPRRVLLLCLTAKRANDGIGCSAVAQVQAARNVRQGESFRAPPNALVDLRRSIWCGCAARKRLRMVRAVARLQRCDRLVNFGHEGSKKDCRRKGMRRWREAGRVSETDSSWRMGDRGLQRRKPMMGDRDLQQRKQNREKSKEKERETGQTRGERRSYRLGRKAS